MAENNGFYHTTKWLKVAAKIRKKYYHQCQVCGKKGIIVHHIDPLTDSDYIRLPYSKCFGEHNLTLVCLECHNSIHYNKQVRAGCYFDEEGNIQVKEDYL